MQAIILVGLSGSGKSRTAAELKKAAQFLGFSCKIHSTDEFFIQDGEYKFNPKMLPEYHKRNQEAFERSLAQDVDVVICDNTNLQSWQREPYITAAHEEEYEVEVRTIGEFTDDAVEVYSERNTHGVPRLGIFKQLNGYEEYDSEIEG